MLTAKRSVALGVALFVLSLLAQTPPAGAVGAGVCTISGTISFTPSPQTPTQGGWSIEPAVIDCYGVFNKRERILGGGSFTGSGTYTTAPGGRGACLQHVASGTVDYMIRTSEQDVHVVEPQAFVLAGAGSFTSPTLQGTFQLTPTHDGEGQCLTEPVTRAFFLAEGLMVRFRPPTQGHVR
jgi:hypothetical protein